MRRFSGSGFFNSNASDGSDCKIKISANAKYPYFIFLPVRSRDIYRANCAPLVKWSKSREKLKMGPTKGRENLARRRKKVAAAKIGDCDWKMRICRVSIYQTIKL